MSGPWTASTRLPPLHAATSAPRTTSGALVGALDRSRAALPRKPLREASLSEGRNGVGGDTSLLAEPRQQRPHIRLERLQQDPVRAQDIALALRCREPALVDEQRLRVRGLDVHDRLDHRVDLPL